MITIDEQLSFFKLIGVELKEKTECFVIGGSAMMFYGAKESTKDIDLVFLNKEALNNVKDVLSNLGYINKNDLIKIFRYHEVTKNKPIMMVGKNGERFDLFLN